MDAHKIPCNKCGNQQLAGSLIEGKCLSCTKNSSYSGCFFLALLPFRILMFMMMSPFLILFTMGLIEGESWAPGLSHKPISGTHHILLLLTLAVGLLFSGTLIFGPILSSPTWLWWVRGILFVATFVLLIWTGSSIKIQQSRERYWKHRMNTMLPISPGNPYSDIVYRF